VAFQRITTKYFLRVLMKGHRCIMNIGKVVNKKNYWLICEPKELLAEGDAESSMAPRIVI